MFATAIKLQNLITAFPSKMKPCPLAVTVHFPAPHSQPQSLDLPLLDISHIRNHILCGLLCLSAFRMFLRFTHGVAWIVLPYGDGLVTYSCPTLEPHGL